MPSRSITSYSSNAITDIVTINTSTAHGMTSGTYFTIKNLSAQLNGSYTVSQIISSTQFTFIKVGVSTATNIPVSATLIYATVDNTGRPGYMYDENTDTWYLISGKADTGANYTWTGAHLFQAPVTFQNVVYNSQQTITNASAVNVSGSASINGNLTVNGTTQLNNDSSINGGLTLSGNLFLANNSYIDGFKLFIGNSASVPASVPVSGGFIFVQSGALKYMGASGTITTIAPA